jgi:hypothetical protein
VQVDPVKPTSKSPGTNRLKLTYDKLVSDFAFIFRLRRYSEVHVAGKTPGVPPTKVGRCSFDPIKPLSKAPGIKCVNLKYNVLLSTIWPGVKCLNQKYYELLSTIGPGIQCLNLNYN